MSNNKFFENSKKVLKVVSIVGKLLIQLGEIKAKANFETENNNTYGAAVAAIANGIEDSFDARVATSYVKENKTADYYRAIISIAESKSMDSFDKRVAISNL